MNNVKEQQVKVIFDLENGLTHIKTQNVGDWNQCLNAAAAIIMHVAVGGCPDEPLTFADECLDLVNEWVQEAIQYELGLKEISP